MKPRYWLVDVPKRVVRPVVGQHWSPIRLARQRLVHGLPRQCRRPWGWHEGLAAIVMTGLAAFLWLGWLVVVAVVAHEGSCRHHDKPAQPKESGQARHHDR